MRKVIFWIAAGVMLAIAGALLYGSEVGFHGSEEETIKGQKEKEEASDASADSGGVGKADCEVSEDRDEAISNRDVCVEDQKQTLRVYICGAVVHPGVYEFNEGAILMDVVNAAGGFLPEAETRYWNLADYVFDTEQVCIPTQDEACAVTFGPSRAEDAEPEEYGTNRVNINTAGMKELLTLTGIGETKAKAILSYREANGPFSCTADIKKVSGIGDAIYSLIAMEIKVE